MPREEAPLVASAVLASILTVLAGVLTVLASVLAVVTISLTVVSTTLGAISLVVASAALSAIALVVVAITTDGKINSVIDRPALGNWHGDGLMVCSGADRRHPVCTSRESLGDIRSELAVDSSIVETLEERENTWVRGLRGVKRPNRFNDNVVVSDNLPSVVQLLRCTKVGIGSVGEGASLHSLRIHDNGELGVSLDITTIGREFELDRRHIIDTGNITHRCRIARATLNLLAICDGLTDAEVDEVVGADEGICFAGRLTFTVDVLNDRGVQGEGSIRIAISPITAVVIATAGAVVTTVVVVVTTVVVVVTAVVVVVTAVVIATGLGVVAAVAARLIIDLTGYKTIRLRDEEGSGELGNSEENERELKALHGSACGWKGKSGIWI